MRVKQRLAVGDIYEVSRDDMSTADCSTRENDNFIPHFHQSIELVYVKKGMLTAIVDGAKQHVHEKQLLICSSYAVHTYMSEEPNETVVMIVPLSSVPSLQKVLQKKVFRHAVWDLQRDGMDELITLFPLLPAHWPSYSPEVRKGVSYTVLGLAIDHVGLCENAESKRHGTMRDVLRDVLTYLQENYRQPLKLEDVARHFGYSKSRFSRLFHDYLGCSMNEYLMAQRCRHAAEMLLDSELTMLDIALNVGFECLRTFYRAFHACYQCTPSQYVKNHTN